MMKTDKRDFYFLDGLRGMAAIFVVTIHTGDYWKLPFHHAYLAVDIFFLISGFVIANAYERKLTSKRLSKKRFIAIRVIRLYPLFFFSLCLCAAIAAGRAILNHHTGLPTPVAVSINFFLSLFFIPAKMGMSDSLFPLNVVYWSLFFELLVNIIYAFILPILNNKVLMVIVVLAAATITYVIANNDGINAGDTWAPISIIGGFARAVYGIFLGVMIFRLRPRLLLHFQYVQRSPAISWLAFIGIGAVLGFSSLSIPFGIFDFFALTVVFPVLFLHIIDAQSPRWKSTLLFFGAASYPMYVLQVPALALIRFAGQGIVERNAPYSGAIFLIALVIFSVWLERKIDAPLRRKISRRLVYGESVARTDLTHTVSLDN